MRHRILDDLAPTHFCRFIYRLFLSLFLATGVLGMAILLSVCSFTETLLYLEGSLLFLLPGSGVRQTCVQILCLSLLAL